jgi:hypothetical protein
VTYGLAAMALLILLCGLSLMAQASRIRELEAEVRRLWREAEGAGSACSVVQAHELKNDQRIERLEQLAVEFSKKPKQPRSAFD